MNSRLDVLSARVSAWIERFDAPLQANIEQHTVDIIDQRDLPYRLSRRRLEGFAAAFDAISAMQIRGAPLIGLCAAYGIAMAMDDDPSDSALQEAIVSMKRARPTAVNLAYGVDRLYHTLRQAPPMHRSTLAWQTAKELELADRKQCQAIGRAGFELIESLAAQPNRPSRPISILTHCNAGRLATAGIGTALAPIYFARQADIDLLVFVDETRPRNQGFLTAFELSNADIGHKVIVDNAGGFLMQRGEIDLVFVGADRVTKTGDVANKIGTYLKALAAFDNAVPFYSAFPLSTVDWQLTDGVSEIPIETRDGDEIRRISGLDEQNRLSQLSLLSAAGSVENPGFDVTPARLMTGLITEKGVCAPADLSQWAPT